MTTIADKLRTYAVALKSALSQTGQTIVDLSTPRNAAVEALEGASGLCRLRYGETRITTRRAAEKVRAEAVDPTDLWRWARTIDAFQRKVDENPKVEAIMRSTLIRRFTARDWVDLALAAIDQAGVQQEKIEALLPSFEEEIEAEIDAAAGGPQESPLSRLVADWPWHGSTFPVDQAFAALSAKVPADQHDHLRSLIQVRAHGHNAGLE